MKYIIMAGGHYAKFEKPKQLLKVCGEVIIERTIRLLRENGVNDIAITTTNHEFDYLDVEVIQNVGNDFVYCDKDETKTSAKSWFRTYYLMEEPVCYLHGDVYFSDEAIKTIVETPVKDTMFFCCYDIWDGPKDPRSSGGREPLAYKVQNYKLFNKAVRELLQMVDDGKFEGFPPCAWNVYRYINGLDIGLHAKWFGDLNDIFKTKGDYIVINDYTNDVDDIKDVRKIEKALKYFEGGYMVKAKALMDFRLGEFNKLINLERNDVNKNETGMLYLGDTFECNEEMADYLDKNNPTGLRLAQVIEVLPMKEEKPKKVDIKSKIMYDKPKAKKPLIKKAKK